MHELCNSTRKSVHIHMHCNKNDCTVAPNEMVHVCTIPEAVYAACMNHDILSRILSQASKNPYFLYPS